MFVELEHSGLKKLVIKILLYIMILQLYCFNNNTNTWNIYPFTLLCPFLLPFNSCCFIGQFFSRNKARKYLIIIEHEFFFAHCVDEFDEQIKN